MGISIKIEKSQSFKKDLLDGLEKIIQIIEGHKKAEEAKKKKEFERILEKKHPKLYESRMTIHSYSFVFGLIGFLIVLLLLVIDIPEEKLPESTMDIVLGLLVLPVFVVITTTIVAGTYMNLSKQKQKWVENKVDHFLALIDKIKNFRNIGET